MRYAIPAAIMVTAAMIAGCGHVADPGTDSVEVLRQDCIETRSVVAYHRDTAPYWTDQRQRFCPSGGQLEVWGTEPEGAYHCTYSKGQFSKTGLDGSGMNALPAGLMNGPLAELVYYGFTAGAGFEPGGMKSAEPVRIEGQRYEAFEIRGGSGRTVTVYKNAVSEQLELVRVTDVKGLDWLARSFNPRYNERFQRMIPRRIDVFDVRDGIAAKTLLIEFEFIDVQ